MRDARKCEALSPTVFACTARIFWRYNMMYISERCYEAGGTIWDKIFDEICWCASSPPCRHHCKCHIIPS